MYKRTFKGSPITCYGKFPCQGKCHEVTKGLPFSPEKAGAVNLLTVTEGAAFPLPPRFELQRITCADSHAAPSAALWRHLPRSFATVEALNCNLEFYSTHKTLLFIKCYVPVPRASVAGRQPFCRYATFPLTGEFHTGPPLQFNSQLSTLNS